MAASKTATRNVIAILAMLLLSVAGGLLTERALSSVRQAEYPRGYDEFIVPAAYENRIPEWAAFAAVKMRSDFEAAKRSPEGLVGLFQLSEEQYYILSDPSDALDPGLLYDPEVNIRLGCRWISSLYERYGSWEAVWAAMYAGDEAVDGWMVPSKDGSGKVLGQIPDEDTAKYTEKMIKITEKYKKIYTESLSIPDDGTDASVTE
ncbi:MAG: transglycosylase SLT domain-containing protein [Clostridia bacterium]|nr:transglycosylase SLT domain-containing protein [Clostridia bacterium]